MDDRDHRLYIDGTWAGGSTGETFDVIDPATEEVAAVMPQASADDVERAIIAARRSSS
jgi:acyl-CoA reductase-like NAD-dependent aldehyde dehydrogenase